MKIQFTDDERKALKAFASKECTGFGVIVCEKKVAFVRKSNFYDNVKYDVGEDCVYDFFNVRDDAILEMDEDISNSTRIYATTSNIENLKTIFTSDLIKIKNHPYDERLEIVDLAVVTASGDIAELSSVSFKYEHFINTYQELGAGLNPIEINSDELKNFISKVNSVKPQNMFILHRENECMAFVSIFGMMMFKKLGNILPNDYPNINFTTDEAEKIRYVTRINGNYVFYDENRRIIKINNTIDSDGYNVIFDKLEIEGKSFNMKRDNLVKILSNINFITSDDKAEFKIKFLKTKMKLSITKNFIVDNCTIEVPAKNADLTGKTLSLSAKIIKDFVSKTNSENVTIGIHREKVLRINSDDINYMFSVLSTRSDD